jgi:hypothetical protein
MRRCAARLLVGVLVSGGSFTALAAVAPPAAHASGSCDVCSGSGGISGAVVRGDEVLVICKDGTSHYV